MSPEQVIEQPLDARSDVFSVGVVLAELLTGRRLFAAANELDVLLMVRDAKLHRFEKYGSDIDAGLVDIVRKSLKKSLDERWQSAAQFRDALGEWLFENRHRMQPKHVSDVVHELHAAVVERRNKTASTSPVPLDEVAVGRAPSEDAAPMIIVEGGDSMPVIQMSYDAPAQPEAAARSISISDLAATSSQPQPSKRAETVSGRPAPKSPVVVPAVGGTGTSAQGSNAGPAPQLARTSTSPVSPRTSTNSVPLTARTATGSTPRLAVEMSALSRPQTDDSAIVDVPIADTISAAIEGITLEDEPPRRSSSTHLDQAAIVHSPAPGSAPTPPGMARSSSESPSLSRTLSRSDDSIMRSFDDLTEEPSLPPRNVPLPSAEDLARKRPPTPPALADIAEPPDDAGEFHTTSPLRVLFRLMTARATGLLVVAIGGIKKEIYVRDGQPEYVSSNVASELFGNYLVSKGVLSDGELAMALAMMPHYGGKLGDTLVGLGLLKPLEVFRHLTRQVRSKIIDVCTWNKGGFGWYAGRENPREAFPLDFNAFEILGAGAMALSDDHIEAWIAKNSAVKLRASRTRRVGPERFEVKGLVQLCEQLDGKKPNSELIEASPDRNERLKVGRMLCLLEACDLARPA